MNAHTPEVGPAEQVEIRSGVSDYIANARQHGEDIDFYFFHRNPQREYRLRKALQFENEKPWLEYRLAHFRREGSDVFLTTYEVHFRDPPFDNDTLLATALMKLKTGECDL